MLAGAAQDCVKQWVYDPILSDGKPVPASTVVTVNFDLPARPNPNDEKIAQQYFPLFDTCSKAVSSNADPAQQVQACGKAAGVAETFGTEERFIERRVAFVYASTAFRRNKQPKESLEYAEKAVAVVGQGHDDGSGASAAYGVRGQAEAALGELAQASDDLTRAEDFERSAITKMGADDKVFVAQHYIPTLKGLLNFHARVLSAMGKPEEAGAKTDEAAKL